jgi:hypothetical protein
MSTVALQYRSHARIEELALGECTMHRAGTSTARWWLLWVHVARETDGQSEDIAVPVIPGGQYTENGPGGRTWGLNKTGPGIWTVSPSINVLNDDDARLVVAGHAPTGQSLWHQTPDIVYVPDDEPWTQGKEP